MREFCGFTEKNWRRRPDLNRGWRFCRPLPYHLATAPIETDSPSCEGCYIFTGEVRPCPDRMSGAEGLACRAGCIRAVPATPSAAATRGADRAARPQHGVADTRREVGAGNGIRTRDFDLGKVALYH